MPLTKEEITEEAEDIIAYEGIENFTMQTLSERLGVKKASLYYHFKSKEEILECVFLSGHRALMNKGFSINLNNTLSAVIEEAYRAWMNIFTSPDTYSFLRIVLSLHFTNQRASEEYRSLAFMLMSQATVIVNSLEKISEENKRIISSLFSSFLLTSLEKFLDGENENFRSDLERFVLLFT